MENIINYDIFLEHLTFYLKLAIHVNKGTSNEEALEKCIVLYNRYKTIELTKSRSDADIAIVRKCLKRLNLSLKVDNDGNTINLGDKNNQSMMVFLMGHQSLVNNDVNEMYQYSINNNINILVGVPLSFIIRETKYRDLLWEYTRSLFYISQIIITRPNSDDDKKSSVKQSIFNNSLTELEHILSSIDLIEEKCSPTKALSSDPFLKLKLIKNVFNKQNITEINNEVKQMFNKKGIGQDNIMTKIFDSLPKHLSSIDMNSDNLFENIIGIAKNISGEFSGEIGNDPDKIKNTFKSIGEIFQDTINNPENNQGIPDGLKNMLSGMLSAPELGGNNETPISQDEMMSNLNTLLSSQELGDQANGNILSQITNLTSNLGK